MDDEALRAAMGKLKFHAFQNRVRVAIETSKRAALQFREARALLGSSGLELLARSEIDDAVECLTGLFAASSQPAKILVLDDERAIATSLVTILEQQGYRAVSAFDGDEAIITAQHFKPDCLVTDVVMPGRNGIETAVAILKILPQCKVLFISGHASSIGLLRDSAAGLAAELVAKPVSPERLLARVSALLTRENGSGGAKAAT